MLIFFLYIHDNPCYVNTLKAPLQGTSDEYPITKTYLYNFDPLKPHFYVVKLGFTRVYIIFLISAQNIDCQCSLELIKAVLTSIHNLWFEQKYEKYQIFLSENFHFWEVKFSVYLIRHVFVMHSTFFCGEIRKIPI